MEKIIEFNLYKYSLPLATSIKIKNNLISERSGVVINIKTSSGPTCFGEAAPLPFLHKENLSEVILQLKSIREIILKQKIKPELNQNSDIKNKFLNPFPGSFNFFNDIFSKYDIFPSVRFGIEMALFNLFIMNPEFETGLRKSCGNILPVCKLYTNLKSDIESDIDKIIENGYKAIKVKVGREPIDYEINRIKKIKKIISDKKKYEVMLRLDSNGLWDFDKAAYFGKQIGNNLIEYIEDPLNDLKKYPLFFSETNIPVALDEKLIDFMKISDVKTINKADFKYLKAFILKPNFIGGFSRTSDLITVAREKGIIPVLSNAFESNLAISSIALFAGFMNLNSIPIGIDTINYFTDNLLRENLKVTNGGINLIEVLKNINKIDFNLLKPIDF
ncbi:MAG: o-succinylbenzoate synthase [Actinobacteria bacterium]|nr:o-succinylbenzoate synthase [Actinomycetota bacterium]